MSEWLDLMLEEISRKKRESREAEDELKRRTDEAKKQARAPESTQSK
ncbi:MAG: hypothetical protein GY783_02295 [Gammaproteobacteria bacterium]|nr:hypothetical protein [Gammaproteobacteria bacterium]